MAVLSNADRIIVWADVMRFVGCQGVTKAQLRAAVDAADDWAEANDTSFNSALPLPARTALNAKQKAALLMYVIARRHGVLA